MPLQRPKYVYVALTATMFESEVPDVTELELVLNHPVDVSTVPHAVAVIETVAPVLGVHESVAVVQRGVGEPALTRGETTGRTSTNANASTNIDLAAERIFHRPEVPYQRFMDLMEGRGRIADS